MGLRDIALGELKPILTGDVWWFGGELLMRPLRTRQAERMRINFASRVRKLQGLPEVHRITTTIWRPNLDVIAEFAAPGQ